MTIQVERLDIPTARVFVPFFEPEAEEARYLGAEGGRGSGKSHIFAEKLVERCSVQPTKWLCIREHQVSLRHSSKSLIETKIRQLKLTSRFRILNNLIECPDTESMIVFQGMKNHTADSIKSFEDFDGAWVEEAQRLSERSLEMLRPTIRKQGSQIWFSWNPKDPKDPVDKFMRKAVADLGKRAILVKANYYDNPFMPETLREEMEYDRRRDPDRYNHIWLGGYDTKSEARVFKRWRVGDLVEFIDLKKKGLRPYYGGDFGFSKDPTVLVELWVDLVKKVIYITAEAWKIGCEIDRTPALFDTVPGAKDWPIICDSARPETISYLQRFGYPKVRPSRKGPNSVIEGVEFLRGFDIVIHPDCLHTQDEFALYSWEVDERTGEVLPKLEDKKNHVIDAARYAIELLRKPKKGLW